MCCNGQPLLALGNVIQLKGSWACVWAVSDATGDADWVQCMQDGVAMLWDLAEGKRLYSLDAGDVIHALCFSPNRYWLCAATQACIKVRPHLTYVNATTSCLAI